jgi:hypothetical protein
VSASAILTLMSGVRRATVWQVHQRPNQLRARAPSPDDNPVARIKADEVQAVLAHVNADRRNPHRWILPSLAHHDIGGENGADHPITSGEEPRALARLDVPIEQRDASHHPELERLGGGMGVAPGWLDGAR